MKTTSGSIESKDPYGRDRDQWPLFRTKGADVLMTHINGFLDYLADRGEEKACLCFYFHPWEFWPMPKGPIHFGEGSVLPDPWIRENCGDVALRELGGLIDMLKQIGAGFHTAHEVAMMY